MTLSDTRQAPQIFLEDPGRLELKGQFIELRAKGLSYAKIAKKLQVSKSTLANWSSELEGEIASLRAMELEALYERYFLAKEGRIRLLGGQLKAIQEELSKRKLDQVSTDKLLDLELRVFQALKEEYTEVRPLSGQEIQALRS
jgi:transcriptional regulator with XRE-family HTH domain